MNINKDIDYIGEEKLKLGIEWLNQKTRKPLFLTGPTSCGKSTFVRTLLKNYVICEDDIDDLEMNVTRRSLVKIACVIDCIEQFQNIDKLIDISKKKLSVPVIFIADDAYEKNFVDLRKNCEWIVLKNENPKLIFNKIMETNGIDGSDYDDFLVASNNNIRQTLNQIEFYISDFTGDFDIDSAKMDFEKDKFEETKKILNGCFDQEEVDDNYEDIFFMMHENASSNANSLEKCSKIHDMLSFVDIDEDVERNNFLLRLGVSNTFKGFNKISKLRFPSYYNFMKTKMYTKKSKFNDLNSL